MNPRSRFIYFGVAILVCALIAGAGLICAGYVASRGVPSRPLVRITETIPAEIGVSSQPVVVFAQASDPEGIAQVEIWVNGQQVSAQTNPDPTSRLPFETSQAWIPKGAGNYLIVLKALDREGFMGESGPRIVQVQERGYQPDPQVSEEYRMREGDTLESVASSLGTTPDELRTRNPGVTDFLPGSTILVPPAPEAAPTGEAIPAPEPGGEDVPVVEPPPPVPAPSGEVEAVPLPDPWWSGLPLPEGSVCFFNPDACRRTLGLDILPATPIYVVADNIPGSCTIEVNWTDQSDSEDGFRIYRFTNRPYFRVHLLEIVGPSAGTGAVLFYRDENPPRGEFFYAVAAYNAGGENLSAPSDMMESEGCPPAGPVLGQMLIIEALAMDVVESYDRLYCYVSLADLPFERVPFGASSFLELEPGGWNIAEHFAGRNKRRMMVSATEPFNIVVECLGWQGEDLINLGRFTRSHPPEEWDGRPLGAGPDGGGFALLYRLVPGLVEVRDEEGRTTWPLVSPRLTVPFNLRRTDAWTRCTEIPGGGRTCPWVSGPGLAWDYVPLEPTDSHRAQSYNVYRRLATSATPELYYSVTSPTRNAPLLIPDCSVTTFYSVNVVTFVTAEFTGEPIQSRLSEELEVPPGCAALEITLESLEVRETDDDDIGFYAYEAYGWLDFNGHRISWNAHCDPGFFEGCVYVGPSTSTLPEDSRHSWSDFMLNIGDGWRRDNNVIHIPIEAGEALSFMFTLMDHDDWTPDERWCGGTGRSELIVSARSAAEWQSLDQVFTVNSGANCTVQFRVRGSR